MKKLFCLLLVCFLLTGCEATYNLKIRDNTFKEELYINNSILNEKIGESTYKELIDRNVKTPLPVLITTPGIFENYEKLKGYKYYKKKIVSDDTTYGMKINHTFTTDNYGSSTIPNEAFNIFNVTKEENTVILSTSKDVYAFDSYQGLDKITIKFKTNNLVKSNNADSVKNNTYIWTINKNEQKSIYFEYYPSKHVRRPLVTIFITTIALLIVISLIFYIRHNNKKNNMI